MLCDYFFKWIYWDYQRGMSSHGAKWDTKNRKLRSLRTSCGYENWNQKNRDEFPHVIRTLLCFSVSLRFARLNEVGHCLSEWESTSSTILWVSNYLIRPYLRDLAWVPNSWMVYDGKSHEKSHEKWWFIVANDGGYNWYILIYPMVNVYSLRKPWP